MLRRVSPRLLLAAFALAIATATTPLAVAQPADDQALALRFRPHLYFDSKERWRPIDVDRFLAEPGHRACPLPPGSACASLTSLAQLVPPIAYLDLRGTRPNGGDASALDLATCPRSVLALLDCDLGGRSVIYAHVTRDPARTAIDYWWFLRYNDALKTDRHEGDWEGVTVITDAGATHVLEAHLAAHRGVFRYRPGVVTFEGEHLVVYVARGSHASYPRPCRHALLCRQPAGPLPEMRSDGRDPWVDNPDAQCAAHCVALLPTQGGAPSSWEAWNGRWGKRGRKLGAFPPPQTPAFQGRYLHPFVSQLSARTNFHS